MELTRVLAMRWVVTHHAKYFGRMMGSLFGAKNLMGGELARKEAMRNSRSPYAKSMGISFAEIRRFWKYLDGRDK